MLPPNIWDAWYILGTAVLQSITEAVVNKVVRSWLNPLGKISPGGVKSMRRGRPCTPPLYPPSAPDVFWLRSFSRISPASPPSAAASQHTDGAVRWEAALDYKAQICLGTHGSELSNKTCGSPPGAMGLLGHRSDKQKEGRGEDCKGRKVRPGKWALGCIHAARSLQFSELPCPMRWIASALCTDTRGHQ